jgi:hypothetical protein
MGETRNTALGILADLESHLRPVGDRFADMASELARLVVQDFDAASEHYCSLDWWGGAGSLADEIPQQSSVARHVMRLLVELVDAFELLGVECPRARSWASVFRDWLTDGVF